MFLTGGPGFIGGEVVRLLRVRLLRARAHRELGGTPRPLGDGLPTLVAVVA